MYILIRATSGLTITHRTTVRQCGARRGARRGVTERGLGNSDSSWPPFQLLGKRGDGDNLDRFNPMKSEQIGIATDDPSDVGD